MKRDSLSKGDALKRYQAQMPIKQKVKMADWVINNSSDLKHLELEVDKVFNLISKSC
jgi:dephospho-CoA kinase